MASFKSVLSDIGNGIKRFFSGAAKVVQAVDKVAIAAEPIVEALFPGSSTLFNSIAAEVGKAEGLALAAGQQDGTGTQKAAAVISSIGTSVAQYEKDNNITVPHTAEQIQNLNDAVVKFLNNLNPPAAPKT